MSTFMSLCRRTRAALVFLAGVAAVTTLGRNAGAETPFSGQSVVRVDLRDQRDLLAVTSIVENIWNCSIGVGPLDVQVTPPQLAALRQLGLEPRELIPDVGELLEQEQRDMAAARAREQVEAGTSWYITYRTLAEFETRMLGWADDHPDLVTPVIIGASIEGRPIRGVRLSAPDQPGNPRSERPQVLFNGGQHAREWVSPMTTMYIAEALVEGYGTDPRLRQVLDRAEVIVIPVVNPDGYVFTWANPANRLWRKNRRVNAGGSFGVDLNRNWGFQWGGEGASATPTSDIFRGTAGFSEPETAAMRDFMRGLPRLRAHIDFHSFTQIILSPWAYTSAAPAAAPLFETLNAEMLGAIEGTFGADYRAGQTYNVLYAASGSAPDWVYGALGVPSWTIELRDRGRFGFVLPTAQILPTAQENFNAALRLMEWSFETLDVDFPTGLPEFLTGTGVPLTVRVASGSRAYAGAAPLLRWREVGSRGGPGGGEFAAVTLEPAGTAGLWSAWIPNPGCGSDVEYFFEVSAQTGEIVRWPWDAPARVLRAAATHATVRWTDDMETDRGWVAGLPTDTATTGRWERADPQRTQVGNPPVTVQPDDDATPGTGTRCWITGAAAGSSAGANDVDGGVTTLTSPTLDLTPPRASRVLATRVSYARWYYNEQTALPNNDTMLVQVSNDNGATWTLLEEVSSVTGRWERVSLELPVPPTATVRLRFIARDLGPGTLTEAGVDDVRIEQFTCPRSGDFDGSGGTPDGADIDSFFAAWLAGEPVADFNESGGVPDGDDIDDFFLAWLRG